MSVPNITHLQFLIFLILKDGDRPGRYIREALEQRAIGRSLAAFYQAMARLETGGFVEGSPRPKMVNGRRVRERWYRLTVQGKEAWNEARRFYVSQAPMTEIPGLQTT